MTAPSIPDPSSGHVPGHLPTAASRPRPAATDAERRALASVLRLRILRLCLHDALTNKQLAGRLGRDPASVLHHVRTLLHQGFLRTEEPRPGPRGSTEVPYRATGKSWELDFGTPGADSGPGGTGPGTGDLLLRTFLDEVSEVPPAELNTSRMGLQLTSEHLDEFDARLRSLLEEFHQRGPDEGGRRFSVFVAVHPEPSAD
ncbi:helix-turn-helix domain-containing protein [Nakamurella sp. PAMC28650]|uniref:helix-turn-helix domain-containing protein n=1 Tax=Nakamurella sp. PAMC28650 TaxID=2762325 RepID=UPI00164D2A03|nr:helix-turn-helix domain-containing protein [Nakamurella sp. PAMC28650]QNK83389.1 helix-turn-helix domain-containing protein [Nakamurella sp. PAMC28650]